MQQVLFHLETHHQFGEDIVVALVHGRNVVGNGHGPCVADIEKAVFVTHAVGGKDTSDSHECCYNDLGLHDVILSF